MLDRTSNKKSFEIFPGFDVQPIKKIQNPAGNPHQSHILAQFEKVDAINKTEGQSPEKTIDEHFR